MLDLEKYNIYQKTAISLQKTNQNYKINIVNARDSDSTLLKVLSDHILNQSQAQEHVY